MTDTGYSQQSSSAGYHGVPRPRLVLPTGRGPDEETRLPAGKREQLRLGRGDRRRRRRSEGGSGRRQWQVGRLRLRQLHLFIPDTQHPTRSTKALPNTQTNKRTNTQTNTHTHTHTHTHANKHASKHTHTNIQTNTPTNTQTNTAHKPAGVSARTWPFARGPTALGAGPRAAMQRPAACDGATGALRIGTAR